MTQDPLETPVSPDGGSVGSSSLTGDVAPDRLACFGVTVRFGGLVAVNDVDLAVPPSTIVGLVGPNGAGKSTLFGVLSGLLPPTHGRVVLDGEDITDSRPQLRAARGLARTFQHPELFTGLTVRDHLVLSYRAKHARGRIWSDMFTMGSLKPSSPQETETIGDLIDLLGLSFLANTPALGLPLGMSRLVEIGRALAASPTVLLLDEPSSGLDSAESTQFEQTLRMVASERGISVLLVEHDVELVMRLCKTVYVLDFGALIASGSPADIRANHAVRSAYLGEEVADAPSSSVRSSAEGTDTNGEVLEAEAALGRSELPDAASDGGTTLTVDNLTVHYGEAVALEGVSFQIAPGKALAVLGPNGAGKSSLARSISGLVPASGGSVAFEGQDITSWHPYRIRRAGLLHLPEGRGVFGSLSVTENLRMAAEALEGRQARRDAVQAAFEIFPPLAARRRQTARLLSGGEQQMLSLARALVTSPKLLIADEMSLGLAPRMVDLVFEGLTKAREAGVTVIMIEQYVHRALGFADDCLILQHGIVRWQGPADAAKGELLRHYLGEAMTVA